jgi:hypothetical protein
LEWGAFTPLWFFRNSGEWEKQSGVKSAALQRTPKSIAFPARRGYDQVNQASHVG